MPEIKKNDMGDDMSLKKADAQKSYGDSPTGQIPAAELFGGKKVKEAVQKRVGKRKLPIAVDVIIGVLMLSLLICAIVGAYMLFRYFSSDYYASSIKYTVVCPCDGDISNYAALKNQSLFYDATDNTYYFGKITDVNVVASAADGGNMLVMIVNADVRYRSGEGYSISENRIAVGSEYTVRASNQVLNITVTELERSAAE